MCKYLLRHQKEDTIVVAIIANGFILIFLGLLQRRYWMRMKQTNVYGHIHIQMLL